jgi:hypothetical protein
MVDQKVSGKCTIVASPECGCYFFSRKFIISLKRKHKKMKKNNASTNIKGRKNNEQCQSPYAFIHGREYFSKARVL